MDELLKEILEAFSGEGKKLDSLTIVTGTQFCDCTFIQRAPSPPSAEGSAHVDDGSCESHTTSAAEPTTSAAEPPTSPDSTIAAAIYRLMERQDEHGQYVFDYGNQWQSVYRVLVDRGRVRRGDYAGFGRYIDGICQEPLRVPLVAKSLSKTDVGMLSKPYKEWDVNRYDGTRTIFERYDSVAKAFLDLLPLNDEENVR